MSTASGSSRIGLVAIVAGAAIVAAVVIWPLLPSGALRFGSPAGEPDHVAPSPSPGTPAAPGRPATRAIAPRAFSESEPAEGDASRAGKLEIEVITPEGGPAANARLALIRDEKLLGVGTTNAAGVVALHAGEGEAQLSVVSEGVGIQRTTVSIEPGRRRVELPLGAAITGRIELRGPPPLEPIEIQAFLYSGSEGSDVEKKAFRNLIRPRLKQSPGGNFELRGLEPGSVWTLHCWHPVGFRIDDVVGAADGWRVYPPASGLVIKMTHLPVIRGRVVAGETKAPVAHATCTVALASADQPAPAITGHLTADGVESARSDDGGRFAVPVPTFRYGTPIAHAELTLLDPGALSKRVIRFDPAPTEDLDLGDVEIPAVRTLEYLVTDPAGAPIEGAYARLRPYVDPSTRTDAQGRGRIEIGPEYSRVIFGALRFAVVEVPIPKDGPDPLRVVLEPTAGLEVRIVSNEGPVHKSVRLRLKSAVEDLLPKLYGYLNSHGHDQIVVEAGGSTGGGSCGPEGCHFTFSPLADGRYVIAGLRSGVPIKVEAIDGLRRSIASTTITLGPREWKSVEVKVTKAPRTLRGVVRDATGEPIEDAWAEIYDDPDTPLSPGVYGLQGDWDRSDAEGRFVLEGIFDPVVNLSVAKSGYVRIMRSNMPLPAEGEELDLRMENACKITVKVVREGGAPVAELNPFAIVAGYPPIQGSQDHYGLNPDTYYFEVPLDVEAKITFELGGRKQTHVLQVKPGLVETITIPEKP